MLGEYRILSSLNILLYNLMLCTSNLPSLKCIMYNISVLFWLYSCDLLTTSKNTDLIICSYELLRVLVKALR